MTPADDPKTGLARGVAKRLQRFAFGSERPDQPPILRSDAAAALTALTSAHAQIATMQADHAEAIAGKVVMSFAGLEEMRAQLEDARDCVDATQMQLRSANDEIERLRAERDGEAEELANMRAMYGYPAPPPTTQDDKG